jgi:hypothetical protein
MFGRVFVGGLDVEGTGFQTVFSFDGLHSADVGVGVAGHMSVLSWFGDSLRSART